MQHTALGEERGATIGPLLTLGGCYLNGRFACEGSARRGRRYPQGAHAVAVSATLRLRCAAHLGVAPRTRFVRCAHYAQTGGAKSVLDARCARRLQGCAARRHRNRPLRVAPAALPPSWCSLPTPPAFRPPRTCAAVYLDACWPMGFGFPPQRTKRLQRGRRRPVGSGGGDFWGDEQRRLGVGARSAHPKLTRRACLSVANEVSAASSRRDAEPSSTVESARSADPPSQIPRQAPPGDACRAALTYTRIADAQPAATGRNAPLLNADWLYPTRVARGAVDTGHG